MGLLGEEPFTAIASGRFGTIGLTPGRSSAGSALNDGPRCNDVRVMDGSGFVICPPALFKPKPAPLSRHDGYRFGEHGLVRTTPGIGGA